MSHVRIVLAYQYATSDLNIAAASDDFVIIPGVIVAVAWIARLFASATSGLRDGVRFVSGFVFVIVVVLVYAVIVGTRQTLCRLRLR